jgi:hypothetical protein
MTDSKEIILIDFGDSHNAPFLYEWPPIVFALFKCCPVLMKSYFEDYETDEFIALLTRGVMLHDFGGDFAANICKEISIDISSITDIGALRNLIHKRIRRGITH